MPCETEYDELMSLKLDGLLDVNGEYRLNEHLQTCADCTLLMSAMRQASDMLWASALEPLPVPATLHTKVMMQIAVSAPATVLQLDPFFQPGIGMVANAGVVILPMGATRRLHETPTMHLAGYSEWQSRMALYLRGLAAVGLSIAGTIGLLLALALSGAIKFSGPVADAVGTLRTFFQAIDSWVRSVFVNFGPGLIVVGASLVGILLLAGWQVVSSYHRSALENRGNTGVLEALA